MSSKKVLLFVVATDGFPSFFRDSRSLAAITDAGHSVVALCPIGTGNLIDEWKRENERVSVREFDDVESGIIRTLNAAISELFDWREHDLLIVNNTDCLLSPHDLNSIQDRMYAFDRYAIGNPRMNIDGWVSLQKEDAEFAAEHFPAITRLPYPTSSFAYIKGIMLSLFGAFADDYHSLEASLIDFSLRINEYGYDTVMLNHVYVDVNLSSMNPPAKIGKTDLEHTALSLRYGYLKDIEFRFEATGIDPIDRFKEIARRPTSKRPRILLDYSNMADVHVGTTEYQMGLLRHLVKRYRDKYEICVHATKAGAEFHHIADYCENIVYEEKDLGVYDLGVYASQPTNMIHQIEADRHCARMVYTAFDSIQLRCSYISYMNSGSAAIIESVRCGLENCDGIISISDYSRHDLLDYYQDDETICNKPIKRIYIATDFGNTITCNSQSIDIPIPFEEYVLLAGNPWFKHKALSNAINALKDMDENFVVIGYGKDDYIFPNVFGCSYGHIKEEVLVGMYRRCKLFVFPSVYEGFGLPIVNALKCNKNVVVNDNPLNREIISHFSIKPENVAFYSTFEDLPAAVEKALAAPQLTFEYNDSWDAYVDEFSEFVDELIAKPLDFDSLRRRHRQYAAHWQMLDRNYRVTKYDESIVSLFKTRAFKRLIEDHPDRLAIWRNFRPIRDDYSAY